MKHYKKVTICRLCGDKDLKKFFDLGDHPISEAYLKSSDEQEDTYPLSLSWCTNCSLVQLNETIDPEKLFSHHPWVTGTSKAAREFSQIFKTELINRTNNPKKDYVLEIASNDGTFLRPFIDSGYEVLGIDSAQNVVEVAEQQGIPTLQAFWSEEQAQKLIKERGPARMVFARNVLPHVADTHSFVNGLAHILHEEGTLAIEVHYSKTILEELHYDYIYHAHIFYFTLQTLEGLLNDHGLFVFDITESPISGGGIVVYASKKKRKESQLVTEYRSQEKTNKTNAVESWETFAQRACKHKDKLMMLIQQALDENKTIYAYGASARSSTLMNFCGITAEMIPLIADKNPAKQGLYTPGTHIPIQSPEEVIGKNPDYLFLSAWNFRGEIRDYVENELGYTGDYIIPLPGDPTLLRN